MLRTLQTLRLFTLHQETMTQEWKIGLNNWFMTWNRMALQDLGNTTLFALCAAPEDLRKQFQEDHVYSPQGIQRIQELMRKADCVGTPIARPNFTGKHRILSTKDGKYPIRILKNNQTNQSWLLAFTSREEAAEFVEKNNYPDLVIGLSLDELAAQVGDCTGVLVDPVGLSMSLLPKVLEEAMEVRSQQRVIYRPQPPQAAEAAKEESQAAAPAEAAPAAVPAEEVPQEPAAAPQAQVEVEPSDDVSEEEDAQDKGGFFSRLFGK
jgi:hypothetical protein